MAQKVNPISIRLKLNRDPDSSWFSDYHYDKLFFQDVHFKNYFSSIKQPNGNRLGILGAKCIFHHYPKRSFIHLFCLTTNLAESAPLPIGTVPKGQRRPLGILSKKEFPHKGGILSMPLRGAHKGVNEFTRKGGLKGGQPDQTTKTRKPGIEFLSRRSPIGALRGLYLYKHINAQKRAITRILCSQAGDRARVTVGSDLKRTSNRLPKSENLLALKPGIGGASFFFPPPLTTPSALQAPVGPNRGHPTGPGPTPNSQPVLPIGRTPLGLRSYPTPNRPTGPKGPQELRVGQGLKGTPSHSLTPTAGTPQSGLSHPLTPSDLLSGLKGIGGLKGTTHSLRSCPIGNGSWGLSWAQGPSCGQVGDLRQGREAASVRIESWCEGLSHLSKSRSISYMFCVIMLYWLHIKTNRYSQFQAYMTKSYWNALVLPALLGQPPTPQPHPVSCVPNSRWSFPYIYKGPVGHVAQKPETLSVYPYIYKESSSLRGLNPYGAYARLTAPYGRSHPLSGVPPIYKGFQAADRRGTFQSTVRSASACGALRGTPTPPDTETGARPVQFISRYISTFRSPGRPGGPHLNHIQSFMSKKCNTVTSIVPIRVSSIFQSASLIAQDICFKLEQKKSFRQICKSLFKLASVCPFVKGIRISCSGRLNGAEIAKTECRKFGETSLHVFSNQIDYACSRARTAYGILGVKVWISYI